MPPSNSSSEQLTHEREVLEAMIRSEGWKLYVQRVANEWKGDGYFARQGQALASGDPVAPIVVHRTALEIERVLQWPFERVRRLHGNTD